MCGIECSHTNTHTVRLTLCAICVAVSQFSDDILLPRRSTKYGFCKTYFKYNSTLNLQCVDHWGGWRQIMFVIFHLMPSSIFLNVFFFSKISWLGMQDKDIFVLPPLVKINKMFNLNELAGTATAFAIKQLRNKYFFLQINGLKRLSSSYSQSLPDSQLNSPEIISRALKTLKSI